MIAPVPTHVPTGGLPSSDWFETDPEQEAVPGALYRLRMTIRAPYTPENIRRLEETIRFGSGVNNLAAWLQVREAIEVQSFQVSYPNSSVGGNVPTWTFTTVFRKTGKGTPLAVIIGAIGLVISISILCAVVGYTVEKQGAKIESVASKTIFNPFFLIGAVIVVLAIKGRSLKSIVGR